MLTPPMEQLGPQQIVVNRLLPVDGRVTVQVGDRLQAEDIVATATLPSPPIIVPVASGLGVPQSAAVRHLVKSPGDTVQAGEVVASKKSLIGGRDLTAPAAGRLVAIESGNLIIQAEAETRSVRALLPGQVVGILPNRGVTVAARGLLFRGLGCHGGEEMGRLVLWDPLARIDATSPQITLVPHLDRPTAQEMVGLVRAVVTGTIAPSALAWLRSQRGTPLGPVLVLGSATDDTEPGVAWLATSAQVGQFGALIVADPGTQPGAPSTLAVVQAAARADAAPGAEPLAVGGQVRVLTGPRAGSRGKVVAAPRQAVRLDSGHAALVAVVDYNGERRTEPLANVVQLLETAPVG